jgi:hypothetical protein
MEAALIFSKNIRSLYALFLIFIDKMLIIKKIGRERA